MTLPFVKKEYLTINSCKLDDGTGKVSVDNEKTFKLMINPSTFDDSSSICYNNDKTFGQAGQSIRFGSIGTRKIGFEIVLDGTGVVNLFPPAAKLKSVNDQIDDLKELVAVYEGDKHTPNVIQIVWGTFIFYGALDSMTVNHTLFKASGDPLRSKVKLSFVEYKTPKEITNEANMTSPDLTHIIEVRDGDSLPLLCYKIYKNSAYYLQVANLNNLRNFRKLIPGSKLIFPPLK